MEFSKTNFEKLVILKNFFAADKRGLFIKTFNKDIFKSEGFDFSIAESYYSVSKKNVVRGMHFQLPPNDHHKLVFVPKGKIIDVVVDLRRHSNTYKKIFSTVLSSENKRAILIPKGFAHGFKSMIDNTITMYNVSSNYDKASDSGILYNSINFGWDLKNPIVSERDLSFKTISDFELINPF